MDRVEVLVARAPALVGDVYHGLALCKCLLSILKRSPNISLVHGAHHLTAVCINIFSHNLLVKASFGHHIESVAGSVYSWLSSLREGTLSHRHSISR